MLTAQLSPCRIKRNHRRRRRIASGRAVYAYVGGNPISYADPLGLWVPPALPQGFVDFSAGLGDGSIATLSFGLVTGQGLRNAAGVDGGIDKCDFAYTGGRVAGTALTMAAYAGGAIPNALTHFTTAEGAAGIAEAGGAINASTGATLFGDGVYATAGSRLFVPAASTISIAVDGAGFMRMVPNAAFLNGGSLQTAAMFAGYGALANRDAAGGCGCKN
jgi:hypothetical protein